MSGNVLPLDLTAEGTKVFDSVARAGKLVGELVGAAQQHVEPGASGIKAAVNETILHDVPRSGGAIQPTDYAHHVAVKLAVNRALRLAAFIDDVDRRLDVSIRDVTEIFGQPDPVEYEETVNWSEAAYRSGFDGCIWMTERFNSHAAYVVFGDRVRAEDLEPLPNHSRAFGTPRGRNWLTDICAPLSIEVRW